VAAFFGTLFFVTGLLLVVTVPVFVMAWRRRRTGLAIKFVVVAAAIGVFFAFAAVGSKRAVDNCREVGNYSCFDVGHTGFLFLVGLIYVIAVATATHSLARD
jgi:mannose/fructose/N-acetylgalactosamine-specific phosphotransferase system component IIC